MNKLLTILLSFALVAGPGWLESELGSGGLLAQKGKKKKKSKGKTEAPKSGRDKNKIDYLFIEANTQYLQGNPEEAKQLFLEVLGIDKSHHASMYNVGKIALEAGDYQEAEKYSQMALDANSENYWYYSQLVKCHESLRNIKKATAVQEQLVAKFPKNKDGLFELAQLYIGDNQYRKSIEVYDRLEAQIGMNEDVVFRKHQLYLYLNEPEQALIELNKLIAFFPNQVEYYQAKYDIYAMMGKEAEAQDVLQSLLELDPNDAFALLALADSYKAKGDMEKSDEYLFRAFANPAVDMEAKVQILSGLYRYAESNPEVAARMEKLVGLMYDNHPESAMVNGIKGDVFQSSGKSDSARAYYLKSVEMDATNEEVWKELLFVDSELGNFKALQKDSERALEYFPNQALFLYFFGLGSSQEGDSDGAIYAYEKIKKIGGDNKNLLIQAYVSLGEIYHREEQYKKSDENFESALELDGSNALVLNNFAYFLSLRNDQLERAGKMVQKALEVEPSSSAYQDTYGWILYLQGEYQQAEEWIGKAVSSGPSPEVLEHYGDVWLKLGDTAKARQYWEKAIEEGADNFTIADKLASAGN